MRQSDETVSQPMQGDELVAAWLRHFGVGYPEELDLGTLEAIGHLVRDGCQPPARQSA